MRDVSWARWRRQYADGAKDESSGSALAGSSEANRRGTRHNHNQRQTADARIRKEPHTWRHSPDRRIFTHDRNKELIASERSLRLSHFEANRSITNIEPTRRSYIGWLIGLCTAGVSAVLSI